MAKFKVTYEIEVTADTAVDAAREVEDILKNGNYRPFLVVSCEETGEEVEIDLEGDLQ